MIKLLNNILSTGVLKKKLTIVYSTRKYKSLLKKLVECNLIEGFFESNNILSSKNYSFTNNNIKSSFDNKNLKNLNKYIVYIKYYKNKPIIGSYKSFINIKVFISYKKLLKLILENQFSNFLISSSRGIISNNEIIKYKIGGLLLVKIN